MSAKSQRKRKSANLRLLFRRVVAARALLPQKKQISEEGLLRMWRKIPARKRTAAIWAMEQELLSAPEPKGEDNAVETGQDQ